MDPELFNRRIFYRHNFQYAGIEPARHVTMRRITDQDYRSHTLPCYPLDEDSIKLWIEELETRVVLEINDQDYRFSLAADESFYSLQAA